MCVSHSIVQIVEMQEESIGRKYYKVIADHYSEVSIILCFIG